MRGGVSSPCSPGSPPPSWAGRALLGGFAESAEPEGVKPWKERRMGDMVGKKRRMKRGVGVSLPRPIDPWIIWWIAMSLIVPLLAMLECGWPRRDLFQQHSMGEEGVEEVVEGR